MVGAVVGPATLVQIGQVTEFFECPGWFSDRFTFCIVTLGLSHSWPTVRECCNLALRALPLVNLDHITECHAHSLVCDCPVSRTRGSSSFTPARFPLQKNEKELLCTLLLIGLEWGFLVHQGNTVHGLSNSYYGMKMIEPVSYVYFVAGGRWKLTRSYLAVLTQSSTDAVISTGFPTW